MLLVMSFKTLHNLNFRYTVWWQTYVKIQIDLYQRLSILKDNYILCMILGYRRRVPKHEEINTCHKIVFYEVHLLVHAITIAFWIKIQPTKPHGVILTYSLTP